MTRRDTIIIAVFINAAILVGLFISAMRSDKKEDKQSVVLAEATQKVVDLPLAKADLKPEVKLMEGQKAEVKPVEGDEVDLVLKQFAQSASQIAQAPQTGEATAAPTVDFAQDLQALMGNPAPASAMPAVVSTPTPPAVGAIDVTVRKGDALEKIARAHHTTVREIMRLNNLKNANLRVGQVLKVSPGSGRSAVATTVKSEGGAKYYTVKNGDNPWTIAVKNQLKVDELLRLNNMDEQKARHMKPGDKLRIQ